MAIPSWKYTQQPVVIMVQYMPQKFVGANGILSCSLTVAFVTLINDRLSNLHVLTMEYVLVSIIPTLSDCTNIIIIIIMPLSNNMPEIIDVFWSPFSVCFAPLVRRYQWNPAESLVHVL